MGRDGWGRWLRSIGFIEDLQGSAAGLAGVDWENVEVGEFGDEAG